MKKLFVYGLSIAMVAGAASCKKSSKGKMANEWTVSSYERTGSDITVNAGNTTTDEWKVTGTESKETTVYTPHGGTAETTEITINENTYTIEKDGTWTSTKTTVETESSDLGAGITSTDVTTSTTSVTGSWDFANGVSKEFKKNERVIFNTLTSDVTWATETTISNGSTSNVTNTSGTSSQSYAEGEEAMIYTVVESKKKELQLSASGNDVSSSTSTDDGGTTTNSAKTTTTMSYTMTLMQK